MTQNPYINALAAAGYIGLVVLSVFTILGPVEHSLPPGLELLMPMAVLSLFVLSAAIMGYLFLYQPALLVLAGKHDEGATLFLKTVGSFAVMVAALLGVLRILVG